MIYNVPPELLETYSEILESTNDQLSHWISHLGIIIAVLAVLFTLLTIVAAIIIWSQGKSFKSLVRDTISKYENIFNNYIDKKKSELEKQSVELDETLEEYKNKLEVATDIQKKEIEEKIEELNLQKEAIDTEMKYPIAILTPDYNDTTYR